MDRINDRDREFALEFSRFVNGGMCSAHKTGAELANDHRYLVNEKFKVVMGFIEQLAKISSRDIMTLVTNGLAN